MRGCITLLPSSFSFSACAMSVTSSVYKKSVVLYAGFTRLWLDQKIVFPLEVHCFYSLKCREKKFVVFFKIGAIVKLFIFLLKMCIVVLINSVIYSL